MKEYILSEIRDTLFGKIPNEEIPTVIDSISFCLRNYDITEKETSVVVYDNSDSQIISKFFIAKAVEGLCQSSLDYYRVILRAFILQVGKHIKEIVTDDIRVYLAYKKINKCSDNTLNNIRRTLSSFFTWCTEEGIIERNPILRIKGVRQVKKYLERKKNELRYSKTFWIISNAMSVMIGSMNTLKMNMPTERITSRILLLKVFQLWFLNY